jgi:hypothetical protein
MRNFLPPVTPSSDIPSATWSFLSKKRPDPETYGSMEKKPIFPLPLSTMPVNSH